MNGIGHNGGPAFAYGNHEQGGDAGMSLRDYFAGQVLAALAVDDGILSVPSDATKAEILAARREYWAGLAQTAYIVADAMLAAREAGQ